MSIQGKISPRIISSISTLYDDTNRVFLEFVDNSIDSAEEYFDTSKNEYTRPIKISLEVNGKNYRDCVVVISDNCKGIPNIEKIVQNIGNSDKKAQPWTNGQFGYGMCSFIACCDELEVVSKASGKNALEIGILKEHFLVDNQEDFVFNDPVVNNSFEYESGTKVTLKIFDKNNFKNINIQEIKDEIEKHFELLLGRKNLEIKLISGGEEFICKPFDYSSYEGKELEEYIDKTSNLFSDIDQPIHLFIKVTKGKDINKRPVFIVKGRRITEIKDIKAFKSDFKSDIWNHPNITGYVDLGNYIEPNISRINGFKPEYKEKANKVFNWLIEKESLILDLIREGNEETQEKHYQQLEDILSKALSKIARIDAMNFRTEYFSGNDIKLQDGAVGTDDSIFPPLSNDPNSPNPGIKNDDVQGDNPNDEIGGNNNLNKEVDNPFEDKEPQGAERKKSGFNIKISDLEPNVDADTGKQIKSRLLGNTIEIFRRHPEFEDRVEHFRGGEPKISQRLVTYLAGEITVHYKDKYYMKSGVQPSYDKKMFQSLVESIYLFEDLLKDAVGKNLSSWNQ